MRAIRNFQHSGRLPSSPLAAVVILVALTLLVPLLTGGRRRVPSEANVVCKYTDRTSLWEKAGLEGGGEGWAKCADGTKLVVQDQAEPLEDRGEEAGIGWLPGFAMACADMCQPRGGVRWLWQDEDGFAGKGGVGPLAQCQCAGTTRNRLYTFYCEPPKLDPEWEINPGLDAWNESREPLEWDPTACYDDPTTGETLCPVPAGTRYLRMGFETPDGAPCRNRIDWIKCRRKDCKVPSAEGAGCEKTWCDLTMEQDVPNYPPPPGEEVSIPGVPMLSQQ